MRKQIIILLTIYLIFFILFLPKQEVEEYEYINYYQPELIEVELTGAVVFPGTYKFYNDKTVKSVIDWAGGETEDANLLSIDYNKIINKSMTIYVEYIVKQEDEITEQDKININTANYDDLLKIPNISEKKAVEIIEYRILNGPFSKTSQLINITGIGEITLEKILPYVKTK